MQNKRYKGTDITALTSLRTGTNLVAVAGLFMFGSYRVKHWDDVRRTVGKVSSTRDWRLMDVHRVSILKDRKTEAKKHFE